MPFADLPNLRIHYALSGNPLHPALILSNSLGTNFSMWDPQTSAFAQTFHLLRYDMRGHGQSSVPAAPYSVPELAADVLALADSLDIADFHFCGLSIGGMIGMALALNSPHRLKKLVLCSTAAKIGTQDSWNTRIATVRAHGMQEIARGTAARWFTASFQTNSPETVAVVLREVETLNPEGYIGGCSAVRDFDARNQISGIRVPTLVLSATHDPTVTPADGHFLADHISGARYAELNASHISSIEDPSRLTGEVLSFLTQ